jgi:ribosomal protein S6--L-glutamate ligase
MQHKLPKIIIVTNTKNAVGALKLQTTAQEAGYSSTLLSAESILAAKVTPFGDIIIPRFGPKSLEKVLGAVSELEIANPDALFSVKYEDINISFDKWLTYQAFVAHEIATPKTQLIKSKKSLDNLASKLPFIVKPRVGNRGMGVSLIKDAASFAEVPTNSTYIAQEFMHQKPGTDVRAFVVGDRVVAAMLRVAAEGEVISNLAQGGSGITIELNDEDKELAISASRALGAEFAGVDLMWSDRGMKVLEVNASPGFKISEITGVDICREVLDHLVSKFNSNQHDSNN